MRFDKIIKDVLNEQARGVVAHGFSDSGVSSFRYTILDPHIKINQRLKHGVFEEDYETIVYNSLEEAYNELVKSLKRDKLNLQTFKEDFMRELLSSDTVIVYSFHTGNHFHEQAHTLLIQQEGRWDEVPVDLDNIPSHSIIKEYETTEEDYNLRADIPYDEIVPSREQEGNFYNQEQFKKTIKLPITAALKAIVDRYEQNVTHQIAAARRGEYTVGQMQSVKDDEIFVNLLKQGKLTRVDALKFNDYLYNCIKWFPQYKDEITRLRNFIQETFKGSI